MPSGIMEIMKNIISLSLSGAHVVRLRGTHGKFEMKSRYTITVL